ncbi:MAG: phosphotransferase [Myxococcota bacterium]
MKRTDLQAIVGAVRPGAKLEAWTSLTGGVSAKVLRLDLVLPGGRREALVLRMHGAMAERHDAALQHALLTALHARGAPVPVALHHAADGPGDIGPHVVMIFVAGTTPVDGDDAILRMAETLAQIHGVPTEGLPALPERRDPVAEVFGFLPEGEGWEPLRARLRGLPDARDPAPPRLLHGDFWPGNVLFREGALVAVLDWEDAALGDPLSDVACSRLELRYLHGAEGAQRFTDAYAQRRAVDAGRLRLWDVYVAAAAQRFMGEWGLPPEREAAMRRVALESLREAGAALGVSAEPPPA